MSIFATPHPTLNPAIFDKNNFLLSDAKEFIQHLLQKIYPLGKVYRLTMMGSNVTHQYDDTSDIDINVMGLKGEAYDDWHTIFKEFNDRNNLLPGTPHPINFFFQEYIPPQESVSWKNSLGAYDITTDQWIKRPKPFEEIGDPSDSYANEIAYVKLMMGMVESEVHAIKTSVANHDSDGALQALKNLQRFMKKIDDDRKSAYRYGGGSPSSSENNLIYKLIEHSEYGNLLQDLIGH